VRDEAYAGGADAAVVSNHWAEGGAGARALAEALISTCEGPSQFKFLYDLNLSIEEKINIISKEIYGTDGIELSELAKMQVETYTAQGYSNLASPVLYHLMGHGDLMGQSISALPEHKLLSDFFPIHRGTGPVYCIKRLCLSGEGIFLRNTLSQVMFLY
jgi:hypothetical protein